MNICEDYCLRGFKKIYRTLLAPQIPMLSSEKDPDRASDIIYCQLIREKPCMVARFGSTELSLIANWFGVRQGEKSVLKYIKGEIPQWWWDKRNIESISGILFIKP